MKNWSPVSTQFSKNRPKNMSGCRELWPSCFTKYQRTARKSTHERTNILKTQGYRPKTWQFHKFFILKHHHSNGFSPKSSKNLQKKIKKWKFPFFDRFWQNHKATPIFKKTLKFPKNVSPTTDPWKTWKFEANFPKKSLKMVIVFGR